MSDYGPDDSDIDSQIAIGRKTYEKQRFGRPQFSFPDVSQDQVDRDRLLSVLLGAGAGANATANAAHPLAALAMGLGGGIGVSGQIADQRSKRQAAQVEAQSNMYKLREQELDLTPVEQVSPDIVRAHPGLKGFTLGQIKNISPLLQSDEKIKQAQIMFQQNAQLRRELANGSPALKAIFEAQWGLPPGTLTSLKTSEMGILKDQADKPLSAELLKLKENANDGINSLNNALAIFDKSGQATKTAAAYGGPGGDAVRAVVGEQAQELRREIQKATDVVTRIRTGAALNQSEQVFYNGLVAKVLQTNGQNRKSMEDLLKFYQKISSDIDSGKRSSGIAALASDPAKLAALAKRLGIDPKTINPQDLVGPKNYSQTATNPQTGQKIGLNEQGQWEVIK